jgi:hypothetical protein
VYFLEIAGIGMTDWVLIVTAAFVFWYAWEARKQAEASRRIAQETERHSRQSLRPIVDLLLQEWPRDNVGGFHDYAYVIISNVGSGPALDIFVKEPYEPEEGYTGDLVAVGSLAAGQDLKHRAVTIVNGVLTVEYSDAFGAKFQSSRTLSEDYDPPSSIPISVLGSLTVSLPDDLPRKTSPLWRRLLRRPKNPMD